jgi:hypothetical protein
MLNKKVVMNILKYRRTKNAIIGIIIIDYESFEKKEHLNGLI